MHELYTIHLRFAIIADFSARSTFKSEVLGPQSLLSKKNHGMLIQLFIPCGWIIGIPWKTHILR